jgi:hypothetical protein
MLSAVLLSMIMLSRAIQERRPCVCGRDVECLVDDAIIAACPAAGEWGCYKPWYDESPQRERHYTAQIHWLCDFCTGCRANQTRVLISYRPADACVLHGGHEGKHFWAARPAAWRSFPPIDWSVFAPKAARLNGSAMVS